MTANVRWVLDPKPDSVDYLGRKVDKIGVALANATTDASGAFKVTFPAPKDFGGLHDIFAVVNGVVYTGCRDSKLYALDAATGREKWRFDAGASWVISSPAVTQGKVFFGTSDSSLYVVVDADSALLLEGALPGILTDRDITVRAVARGAAPNTPVREVSSAPVTIGSAGMS